MKLLDLLDENFVHSQSQRTKKVRGKTVTLTTSYISTVKYKIVENLPDNSYKTIRTVEMNYQPQDRATLYFNSIGREITRNEFKGLKLKFK